MTFTELYNELKGRAKKGIIKCSQEEYNDFLAFLKPQERVMPLMIGASKLITKNMLKSMAIKRKKVIIPRGKYVLVKPLTEQEKENENGIIIPSMVEKEQKSQGEVVHVGAEVKDIKAGDVIVYGAYSGEQLKVKEGNETVDYKLIFDEDIIAFIR